MRACGLNIPTNPNPLFTAPLWFTWVRFGFKIFFLFWGLVCPKGCYILKIWLNTVMSEQII